MTQQMTEAVPQRVGELLDALAACPLLPVVVVGDDTDGAALGAVLVGAGLTAAEVVLRTPSALRVLAELAPTPGLLVGAGTVVEPEQVDDVVGAGAAFVVSPGHDPDVVARARSRGVPAVPGVATATEVQLARRAGLRLLKLFPAGAVGGTALLAGLAGPFPDVAFVPTGGIDAAELRAYLALRSVAAVGGSWCVPADLVAAVTSASGASSPAAVRLGEPRGGGGGRVPGGATVTLDVLALGEVMLRLDPGEGRIAAARSFTVWEGGGEYNAARALARTFGRRAGVLTALVDDPLGHLVEGLVLAGGVDASRVRWVPAGDGGDGPAGPVRTGLNFVERGFGVRGALGVSDRAGSAASRLAVGDVGWDAVLAGVTQLHTGGVLAGLSASTTALAEEGLRAARRLGVTTSYDVNHRPSLWRARGGAAAAREVDLRLAGLADVVLGALQLADPHVPPEGRSGGGREPHFPGEARDGGGRARVGGGGRRGARRPGRPVGR